MHNSTIGYTNAVIPVSGDFTFSEEDAIASLQSDYVTGSTITLPGPDGGHPAPNNGDTYIIADPQNVLDAGGKTLIINGGGYQFLADVSGTPTLVSSVTFGSLLFSALTEGGNTALKTGVSFTFDGSARIWMVN